MACVKICCILMFIYTVRCADVAVRFTVYQGTPSGLKTILDKCAISSDHAVLVFNSVTEVCTRENGHWLLSKDTTPGKTYLIKDYSDVNYIPPIVLCPICAETRFDQVRLIEFENGSSFEIYFSSPNSTIRFSMVIRKNGDFLLKVNVLYAQSAVNIVTKYDNVFSSHVMTIPVVFTVDKIEKIGIATNGPGFDIYYDDEWLGLYQDPSSPYLPSDWTVFSIWGIDVENQLNIHRIKYIK